MDLTLTLLTAEPNPAKRRVVSASDAAALAMPQLVQGDTLDITIDGITAPDTYDTRFGSADYAPLLMLGRRGGPALAIATDFAATSHGWTASMPLTSTQLASSLARNTSGYYLLFALRRVADNAIDTLLYAVTPIERDMGAPTVPLTIPGYPTAAQMAAFVAACEAAQAAAEQAAGDALGGGIPTSEKGQPNGVATLGADGLVPSAQLPAGTSAVSTVFGRTGTVTAQTGDYTVAQVTGAAPLASPPLTGTPTAPTPGTGDDSTKLATTAFVKAVVAMLLESPPAALDTLNELAAALGDDPNFATTITALVGQKLAKASNLSDLSDAATARTNLGLGNVTNTSDAAKPVSTAQQTALDAKADKLLAFATYTASHTLVISDGAGGVAINSASAANLTVPPDSSVPIPVGTAIPVEQQGAGQITFVAASGVTINARGSALKMAGQYAQALLIKRATDTWTLSGDITT